MPNPPRPISSAPSNPAALNSETTEEPTSRCVLKGSPPVIDYLRFTRLPHQRTSGLRCQPGDQNASHAPTHEVIGTVALAAGAHRLTAIIDSLRRGCPPIGGTGPTRPHHAPAPRRRPGLLRPPRLQRPDRSHQRLRSPTPQRPRIPQPHALPTALTTALRQPHPTDRRTLIPEELLNRMPSRGG